jgi:sulfur relay (sulfurtransferase) complex TusBCD TusD component (DsrE family)
LNPGKQLGILVATSPRADDFALFASHVKAALERGHEVALFLMDDGTGYALDARVIALIDAGVEVAMCAMDAERRGIDCAQAEAAGVLVGSQYDHARLVRDSDRFLSFT